MLKCQTWKLALASSCWPFGSPRALGEYRSSGPPWGPRSQVILSTRCLEAETLVRQSRGQSAPCGGDTTKIDVDSLRNSRTSTPQGGLAKPNPHFTAQGRRVTLSAN